MTERLGPTDPTTAQEGGTATAVSATSTLSPPAEKNDLEETLDRQSLEGQQRELKQRLNELKGRLTQLQNVYESLPEGDTEEQVSKQRLLTTVQTDLNMISQIEPAVTKTTAEELTQLDQSVNGIEERISELEKGQVTAEEVIESGQVLNERGELNPEFIKHTQDMIAAYIKSERRNVDQALEDEGKSSQEIIQAELAKGRNLDELFRRAAAQNRIEALTAQANLRAKQLIEERTKQPNGSRFKRVLGSLGLTAGGIIGGTMIRHALQQSLVGTAAGWLGNLGLAGSTRAVSGLSGVAAGALVGGTVGFIRGVGKGKERIYQGTVIVNDVRERLANEQLNSDQALGLLERLLQENKVRGNEQEAYELMRQIASLKAERELNQALEQLQPIEGESSEDQQRRIARTYAEILRIRTETGGSEAERTTAIQNYINEKRKKVGLEALKESGKSALGWAGFGGIFGILFPAPGLATQINTENLLTHGNSQAVAEALRDGQVTAAELNHLAKAIGYDRLGVDLARKLASGETVLDVVNNYAEYAASHGVSDENIHRGLHHILSHPDALAKHWGEFSQVLDAWGGATGHDFTQAVVHGGNMGAFLGTPFGAGEYTNDFSESVRTYLADQHGQWKLFTGGETPWFPFASWYLTAAEAGLLARGGKAAFEKAKGLAKKEAEKKETAETREKGETKPQTRVVGFDPEILEFKQLRAAQAKGEKVDEAKLEAIEQRVRKLTEWLPGLHGHFFFVKDGGRVRAFRMYPLGTLKGNPVGELKKDGVNINEPAISERRSDGYSVVDQVQNGRFLVREYDIESLYNNESPGQYRQFPTIETKNKRGKTFRETWDHDKWQPIDKNPKPMDWDKVFTSGTGERQQLFVSPFEADKYAYALAQGKATPGQQINVSTFEPEGGALTTTDTTENKEAGIKTQEETPTPVPGEEKDLSTLLPGGVEPESQKGKVWLEHLQAAMETKSMEEFGTGNEKDEWVINSLRKLGYKVETEDYPTGETVVMSIKPSKIETENRTGSKPA